MKIDKFLQLSLFVAMSSASYGSYVLFPSDGGADETALNEGPTDWTAVPGPMSNPGPRAFYDTIGSHTAVSVGAFKDDYMVDSDPGPGENFVPLASFSVDHALSPTLALTDAYLAWNFTITDFTNFAPRNDYSFSLLDSSNANLATVNFTNNGDTSWNVSLNGGPSFRAVEAGFNYFLTLSFAAAGANTTATAAIDGFSSSPSTITGSPDIAHVRIGETLGAGGTYGDGFITVAVPEPGTTMLVALLPAVFVLRRRR